MAIPNYNFTFHEGISSIGHGNEMNVNLINLVNIEFVASNTFEATIEGQIRNSGEWKSIPLFKMTPFSLVYTITDDSSFYQVTTESYQKIRVNVTALNGTLSVYGFAVS